MDLDFAPKTRLSVQQREHFQEVFGGVSKVKLMDHQIEGIVWMKNMEESTIRGGGLADDMGLGKTLQTIMCSVVNGINGTLIVCPNALTSGWLAEFDKLKIKITRGLFHGASRDSFDFEKYHVVVTTYGTLVAESKREKSELLSRQWTRVVLDESQIIKNHETKSAKACFALKSRFRWCLSGTPVQNNINELFAALHFLRVPSYSDYDYFCYHVICGESATKVVDGLFLRREKLTTLGNRLQSKKIVDYAIQMSEPEERAYNQMQSEMRQKDFKRRFAQKRQQEAEDDEQPAAPPARSAQKKDVGALRNISYLRMGCNDVRFVKDCDLPDEEPSAKQRAVVDLALQFVREGKKVLIFTQYLDMVARLKWHISEEAPRVKFWSLTGSQNTTKKRDPIISGFQKYQGGAILILQTMVGSVGLNLTQASRVILTEPWWNPFVDDQAMDRAHRIGQTQQVVVYRCFIPKTIEERILVLQDKKRDMVNSMWGNKTTVPTSTKLTKKEVRYLLGRAF